jgi:putative addiction module component (TIGR02574 family)
MSPILKELERKALELSPQEREELADNILRSLDDAPLTTIDEAWVAEAEQRYNDFKSGKTKGVPGDVAFQQIRRELGWQP